MLLSPDCDPAHHDDRVEQGAGQAVQCHCGRKPSYCLTYVSLSHEGSVRHCVLVPCCRSRRRPVNLCWLWSEAVFITHGLRGPVGSSTLSEGSQSQVAPHIRGRTDPTGWYSSCSCPGSFQCLPFLNNSPVQTHPPWLPEKQRFKTCFFSLSF